ncbi:MAG: phenylalanine--tRNA ligase subunit beta [Nitrososphaerota archaeon]|nr:phenylalanine--tRNA ligase subunit beta [Candidatus Calditenuis fumarioli]
MRPERISKFLGREIGADQLSELLARLGISVDEVTGEGIKAEYNPNRPDFSSHAGIARALKGLLGIELGPPRVTCRRSGWRVIVDGSVKRVRPYVVAGLVRGLRLDEQDIAELIAMQEDLHWVLGRDRKKVAIGLHDASKVRPPIRYLARPLSEVRFVPLHESFPMTAEEILERLETGRKYAHLVRPHGLAPLLVDAKGDVLSFPPVINSSLTEVTTSTSDVFIDVTGTDPEAISRALNVLVYALHDMGGRLYSVEVMDGRRRSRTPDLRSERWRVDLRTVNEVLGVALSEREAVRALRMMRLGARLRGKGSIEVDVPPYRADVLHPVDFAEEVFIAMQEKVVPEFPGTLTFGGLLSETRAADAIRSAFIGLGFTEAFNTVLSNYRRDYVALSISDPEPVRILNPVSAEYDILRTMLLPGLLSTLAANKHNPYPQRFFEVGDVVLHDPSAPEMARRVLRAACVTSHSSASYSEIKAVYEEFSRYVKRQISAVERDYPFMIPGRSVSLVYNGREIGLAGEVHPAVLESFGLEMPVAAMEIDLQALGLWS